MKTKVICFSPTGNTLAYAKLIAQHFNTDVHDITRLKDRQLDEQINADIIFFLSPVHAHAVPKIVFKLLKNITFNSYVVPCVVYGSINAGHALYDLVRIIKKQNGIILGGCEIASCHSYLNKMLQHDFFAITEFCTIIESRFIKGYAPCIKFKRHINPLAYIAPIIRARIGVAKPRIISECINCGKCIKVCPVNAIDIKLDINKNKCIRCLACAKVCPNQARVIKLSKVMKNYLNKRYKPRQFIKY